MCNKPQVNTGGSTEASTEARSNALNVVVGVALPDRDRSENEKLNESILLQDDNNWTGSQEEDSAEDSSESQSLGVSERYNAFSLEGIDVEVENVIRFL